MPTLPRKHPLESQQNASDEPTAVHTAYVCGQTLLLGCTAASAAGAVVRSGAKLAMCGSVDSEEFVADLAVSAVGGFGAGTLGIAVRGAPMPLSGGGTMQVRGLLTPNPAIGRANTMFQSTMKGQWGEVAVHAAAAAPTTAPYAVAATQARPSGC